MTEINKGDVINLENGIFIIPNNVEKIRIEIHGGKGGKGEYYGENGEIVSAILDFKKTNLSKTFKIIKGKDGNSGDGGYNGGQGGAGGGGSSAILIDATVILEASGGKGSKGSEGVHGMSNSNSGGIGGDGYHPGSRGSEGGWIYGGSGGNGGGSNFISDKLTQSTSTHEYNSGLAIIEILELNPYNFLIKENNKFHSIKPEFYNTTHKKFNFIDNFNIRNKDHDKYMELSIKKYVEKNMINDEIVIPIEKFHKFNFIIKKQQV